MLTICQHKRECAIDCNAKQNGIAISQDPDNLKWYAFYLHDTVSSDFETDEDLYGASFQVIAGPTDTEAELQSAVDNRCEICDSITGAECITLHPNI